MVLGGVLLLQASGTAQAQDFDRLRLIVEERTVPIYEVAAVARRVGEACIFGATAGAVGAFIVGAPIAANGIAAPSVVSIALGAAAVGCLIGFSGASAASGFGVFWDRRVQPELEKLPGNSRLAVPIDGAAPSGGSGGGQALRADFHP